MRDPQSYMNTGLMHDLLTLLANSLIFTKHVIIQNAICVVCTENVNEPYRELFVWAVCFNRMSLAYFFWRKCPNPIGSALVASKLCQSLAKQADSPAMRTLADELKANARLVLINYYV